MVNNTILFIDLDGTLCVNPFRTAVFPRIIDILSPRTGLSAQELLERFTHEFQQRIAESVDGRAGLAADWDDIIHTIARRLGVSLDVSVVGLVTEFARPPYIRVLDEGNAVLQTLHGSPHRRLVAATMGLTKYQLPVLKGLGLLPLFDDVLAPDQTGFLKTDRRFYSRFTDQVPTPLLISIGDHFEDDVLCPKSFGFVSILKAPIPELAAIDPIERRYHLAAFRSQIRGLPENPPILPDAVITSLTELPELITCLEHAHERV
jgi:FMN phosphatase YigB (HAD superfamily)